MEPKYKIEGQEGPGYDASWEAYQDAEYLHTDTGKPQKVFLGDVLVYTSLGAPD